MAFPYNLHQPDATFTLDPELDEVSGICPLDGNWLAAVEDETRDIYELRNGRIVSHFQSGTTGDSEGIVIIGRSAFILEAKKRAIYEYKDFRKSMAKFRKHGLRLRRFLETNIPACWWLAKGAPRRAVRRDMYSIRTGKTQEEQ